MGIMRRCIEFLTRPVVDRRLQEALASLGYFVDDDPSDPPGARFRRLSRLSAKDLSPLTHDRVLRIVFYLYETNPLAHRIVEMTKDFVIGDGITFSAADPRVSATLQRFWDDPVNLWSLKQHQKVLELGLYGEQYYPAFVNPANGHVRLGYVDPLDVQEVVTDPDNCEQAIGVILKADREGHSRRLRIILAQEEEQLNARTRGARERFADGACFYFAINKVSNATRGRSDLLALIDWLDGYDQYLFNRIDRAALLLNFIWDVTLEGFTAEEIELWLKSNRAPKPGSVRAHNEKVRWQAVSPELRADDASAEARLLRNHIVGNAGFPEHWFGEGGDVNRATAAELGAPALRRLAARQHVVRHMMTFIFRYVVQEARRAGAIPAAATDTFQIILPDLSLNDVEVLSESLNRLTQSLEGAVRQGWLSQRSAAAIYHQQLATMGFEVSTEAEWSALQHEGSAAGAGVPATGLPVQQATNGMPAPERERSA